MELELKIRTPDVSFDEYRSVYFSEDFNQLSLKAASLRERVLEKNVRLPDGRELRHFRLVPDLALPAPLRRLVSGDGISYREISVFDPRSRVAQVSVESAAGDRIQVAGEARFLEDAGGIVLHFVGDVTVKLFGLGTLIEKLIVTQTRIRYAVVEQQLIEYFARRRAARTQ